MNPYTQKHLLRELEWQTRAALTMFDDLDGAHLAGDGDLLDAIVHNLALRIHGVAELLWPGSNRLSDRLFTRSVERLRGQIGIKDGSPLSRQNVEPLVALVRYRAAGVRIVPGDQPRSLTIDWGGGSYDVLPARRELQRLWLGVTDLLLPSATARP